MLLRHYSWVPRHTLAPRPSLSYPCWRPPHKRIGLRFTFWWWRLSGLSGGRRWYRALAPLPWPSPPPFLLLHPLAPMCWCSPRWSTHPLFFLSLALPGDETFLFCGGWWVFVWWLVLCFCLCCCFGSFFCFKLSHSLLFTQKLWRFSGLSERALDLLLGLCLGVPSISRLFNLDCRYPRDQLQPAREKKPSDLSPIFRHLQTYPPHPLLPPPTHLSGPRGKSPKSPLSLPPPRRWTRLGSSALRSVWYRR